MKENLKQNEERPFTKKGLSYILHPIDIPLLLVDLQAEET